MSRGPPESERLGSWAPAEVRHRPRKRHVVRRLDALALTIACTGIAIGLLLVAVRLAWGRPAWFGAATQACNVTVVISGLWIWARQTWTKFRDRWA